jgi:hypothetical protein
MVELGAGVGRHLADGRGKGLLLLLLLRWRIGLRLRAGFELRGQQQPEGARQRPHRGVGGRAREDDGAAVSVEN